MLNVKIFNFVPSGFHKELWLLLADNVLWYQSETSNQFLSQIDK